MMPNPEQFGIGLDTAQLGDWVLRILAIVGAAAVGGFGAGLILQVSAKFLAAQTVPRPLLQIARALGAITCGLVVGYFLLHSGGSGGGWGLGGGPGIGFGKDSDGNKDEHGEKDSQDENGHQKPRELAKGETAVQVEVLQDPSKSGRDYRVLGQQERLKLNELKKMIDDRHRQEPPLEKMVIVVYLDSPDRNTRVVQNLVEMARESSLTPDVSEPRRKAP
jgi:hypothetical protein